ncbi:HAD-like protein [Xylaria venustula]|nr:HAD-like protein [Xylaria venustula]
MDLSSHALVFDLAVLLDRTCRFPTDLEPSQLRKIMNCMTWWNLEKGLITVGEACEDFGILINEDPSVVEDTLDQIHHWLHINTPLVQTILGLKELNHELKICLMSNISREHYNIVRKIDLPWSMFDYIFISWHDGMRKPDLRYFRHVVQQTGLNPGEMVMIDGAAENICAARSVGMQSIFVQDQETKNGEFLLKFFPLKLAETYLRNNAASLHSTVEGRNDRVIKDNFTQLLIFELLGDETLIYLRWPSGELLGHSKASANGSSKWPNGLSADDHNSNNGEKGPNLNVRNGFWNYFYEHPFKGSLDIPLDADTTCIAYLSLPTKYQHMLADVETVLGVMAINQDLCGVMKTYSCSDHPWTTPESCCNMLRLFYGSGYGNDPRIRTTEDWVLSCLRHKACLHGNRRYSTPESFLYFVAHLYVECRPSPLASKLEYDVKKQLEERIGLKTNALALALRVVSCQLVGIDENRYATDFQLLMSLQKRDGGWPAGHFCYSHTSGDHLGNRGLTTALAIQAIRYQRHIAQG